MQSWTTPTPIQLPIEFERLARLDLEFVNVRRDLGSFTALVFVNPEGNIAAGDGREHHACVGSFTIFAPSECWGAEGHCDWAREPVSAFDRRGPHHLTPINVTMEITGSLRRLGNPDTLSVTVHAALRNNAETAEGVLVFERLMALAYE
jgi:hypothetical protein